MNVQFGKGGWTGRIYLINNVVRRPMADSRSSDMMIPACIMAGATGGIAPIGVLAA